MFEITEKDRIKLLSIVQEHLLSCSCILCELYASGNRDDAQCDGFGCCGEDCDIHIAHTGVKP